ncbi:MAG: penicillin acylase family protein, partial [Chloroflexota bacterium]
LSIGAPNLTEIAEIHASLGLRLPDVGSNNWVVGGAKTTTGKPLLANDPHLGIQMPSIWYEMGLHCVPQNEACPYNVVGYTFPGVPGIVIGHNDRIAWGVTNTGPDVQDLFVEEIQGSQSKFKATWEDLQIVEETIKVKGGAAETIKVQITRHGPIMTPVLSGVTKPVALQWTALRERSRLFELVLRINRAKNWSEFRDALKLWDVPAQNFVYADVDGNIGYQMPGNIPIRAKGDGTMPVPGSTGEYEWTGYIPFDELPFVYNPPTHFIATANNAVVPPTYKYLVATDWSAPYRQQRIVDLLKAKDKLSTDDMKKIQGDVYSIPLAQMQKHIVALKPEGVAQTRALEYMKAWDGSLTTENVGGFVLEATYQRLARNLFKVKLGEDTLLRDYLNLASNQNRMMVLALLEQPWSDWWGGAGRDAMLQKSFGEAVDELRAKYGDAPAEWKWGSAHTSTFAHPLGSVQPLDRLFNAGPVTTPGGVFTVFATGFRNTAPYTVNHVSSMRMIVDLSNWGNSLQVHTTGQSGQPLQKHYSDMVLLWRDAQYAPMYFDRAALDKAREGLLVLVP